MSQASEITRGSNSNLAFALQILPRARRLDAEVFYAFCRTMDDLADEPGQTLEQRESRLNDWKSGLVSGFARPDPLQIQVADLCRRQSIPVGLMTAIIDGCLMDLQPRRFTTWEDLEDYIWKVACAVGLVSIRLFGCTTPQAENYAVALGKALQLTNILRDVREDAENGGRIYLPLEDLAAHGYSEQALLRHQNNEAFQSLMTFEAQRARGFFQQAESLLPSADRKALRPARAMAGLYQTLLKTMENDGFRVFEIRYSLPKWRKIAILLQHLVA